MLSTTIKYDKFCELYSVIALIVPLFSLKIDVGVDSMISEMIFAIISGVIVLTPSYLIALYLAKKLNRLYANKIFAIFLLLTLLIIGILLLLANSVIVTWLNKDIFIRMFYPSAGLFLIGTVFFAKKTTK
jgi:chromate transport protein ChrA